ncbi:hypothetical protein [Cellulomonas endophytica]|uniref:hypothetical protein n=1 Tax=Cellulomonas endophytica TaxID=2494735 RepID=UPI001011C8EB|nr:hypothetical protein [Cellulomonas endophytica]
MSMDERPAARPVARRLEGWTVLHGPRVAELPGAGAECIVVGPGGVVVVASVTGRGARLERRTERARRAVGLAGGVVTSLLPPGQRWAVAAVVCVPDARSPHEVYPLVGGARGVAVVGTAALPGILQSLPARLTPEESAAVTDGLVHALVARPQGSLLSTADLPRGLRPHRHPGPAAPSLRLPPADRVDHAAALPGPGAPDDGTPALRLPLGVEPARVPTPRPGDEGRAGRRGRRPRDRREDRPARVVPGDGRLGTRMAAAALALVTAVLVGAGLAGAATDPVPAAPPAGTVTTVVAPTR